MNAGHVMKQLAEMGTARNRDVYARHGAPPEAQFGVSFADLKSLTKAIGRDQKVADALWASGNADARILACMIADPDVIDEKTLEAWLADVGYYVLCDAFSNLTARTPMARELATAWIRSPAEYRSAAGWNVVSLIAGITGDHAWLRQLLETIERDIHDAPNRTRHSMNMALIAIGGSHPELEATAIAAAERIGKVEVDHGQTGCKTPAAAPYIQRMAMRRARAAGGGGKKQVRVRA